MLDEITPYEPALRLRVGLGSTTPIKGETAGSSNRRRTIRPNGTPDWHLLIILKGEFTVNPESDTPTQLAPRQAILFPPHTKQDYMLSEHCDHGETFWAHFFPEASILKLLDWPKISSHVGILQWKSNDALDQHILKSCERCTHYFESNYSKKRSLALISLEEILCLISQANPHIPLNALDDRVASSLHFIANNISKPLTLENISSKIGLSTSRLSHLFISNLNCSVMAYIEKTRIRLACSMLTNTQLPINQIAHDCGFSSSFYFSKRFRKFKEMSPSNYRQMSDQESRDSGE